jgi:Flp pilus assembly protein TadD
LRIFPDVAVFHQRLSYCASQEGNFDEALALNQRAIELDPDNPAFVSDMGWTLVLAGRFKEAEAALLRALEMDPSDERVQANLDYCRQQGSEELSPAPTPEEKPASSAKKPSRKASAPKKRSPRRT